MKFTFVSPSVEYVFGYTPDEALDMDLEDLMTEESFSRVEKLLRNVTKDIWRSTEKAGGFHIEVEMLRKDGTPIWTEAIANVSVDLTGKKLRIQGNSRDITSRKLAQMELSKSEEKYRLLVENETELVVKVDLDGKFLFVSPSYCRTFGKTEEELLGKTFIPLVHEDDRKKTLEAMEGLYSSPHAVRVEQRAMTKEGWRWLAWSDTAILDEMGEVKEIIGVGRDITERKLAEEALTQSEGRLRTVISNLPVVLFSLDTDGIITLSDGKGLGSLGLQPGEVVGLSVFDMYADYPEVLSNVRRALDGEQFSVIVSVDDKYFETWYMPVFNDLKEIQSVIGVTVDISKRLEAERELDRYRNHLEELVEARTLALERTNESLRRFRFALDSAADSMFIIDPETLKFVDLNRMAEQSSGYSREVLLTMGPLDLMAHYDRTKLLDDFRQVLSEESDVGIIETTIRREDGSHFPVEILLRAFESTLGELFIFTVRDISTRKEHEIALRESEAKYRSVLENANEAILVVQDCKLKFFNYVVHEITGMKGDRLQDVDIMKFIHPEDQEMVRQRYQKMLRDEEHADSYDLRIFDSNGTIKWLEVRDVVIEWEEKPATLNFLNDVTLRKQAEQVIHFQASLLNIVRNAIVALDLSGRIVFWNNFAETSYQWSASEAVGMKAEDLGVFDDELGRGLFDALKKVGHWEEEIERVNREGVVFPVYAVWTSIETDGEISGYVGVGVDLSERKKLERDLLQSQKLASLGILSEGIAHELRNPLGFASSAAQLLASRKNLSEEARSKYSTAIYEGVQRANKIVENLLLVGKPKGQLMKRFVSIPGAVHEARSMLSSHANYDKVKVSEAFPSDEFEVFGNLEMLVQLFHNLFVNALNEMPKGGTLHIEGSRTEEATLIHVSDTGPGIPPELLENIFDPFFTAASGGKGIGLGLTLCHFIMDDHDGLIEAVEKEDKGAVFKLTFPNK